MAAVNNEPNVTRMRACSVDGAMAGRTGERRISRMLMRLGLIVTGS